MSLSYHCEVEIMPNGKWRRIDPDYVIFNEHIKVGLHDCETCKCTYCGDPSVFNLLVAKHQTDGRECGLQMCRNCLKIEHAKINSSK